MRTVAHLVAAMFASVVYSSTARAACSWTILSNGTTADATQVMNNLDCLAPLATPAFTGKLSVVQTVSATNPTLDIRVDNGSGTSAPVVTVNAATSYSNVQATMPASRSLLSVGTFGDSSGIGYSAVFRGNVGIGMVAPNAKLSVLQPVSATSPNLDIWVDDGAGNSAPVVTVNAPTSYANVQATLPASRALLSVGTFGDGTGLGYSAVFRGNVGIGTTTPSQALEVNGQIKVNSLASATGTALCINASVIATCSSSRRYKEQIRDADFGLEEIEAMRPVIFKWKGRDETDFGLIAEEIAKIDPRFVTYKAGKIEGVKYPQLTAVLVSAVKEQAVELAHLRTQTAALAERLAALERRAVFRTASIRPAGKLNQKEGNHEVH